MHRFSLRHVTIVAAVLVALCPAAGRAGIISNFSSGNDNSNGGAGAPAADSFYGAAGGGWLGAWGKSADAGVTVTASVVLTNPLSGGGNHLGASNTGAANNGVVSRQYGSVNGDVQLNQTHVISWDYRIDEPNLNNFTASKDRYQFFERQSGAATNTDSQCDWIIATYGADPLGPAAGFAARHWLLFDGSLTTNTFAAGVWIDTGITIAPGTVYHFAVTTNPAAKTWSAAITSNTGDNFTSGLEHYRDYAGSGVGNTPVTAAGGFLEFGAQADSASDTRAYSVDTVFVAAPEPASILLLGFGGLLVLSRRRAAA
jgi:hypothetical protein